MIKNNEKRPLIHWVFFWMAGVGTLFVWNCVLSLTDYLSDRYDQDASKYYPFFFNAGGFLAFLCFNIITRLMSFKRIIFSIPIVLVVIFVAIFAVGELVEEKSIMKFAILLFLVLIAGLFNSILQTTLIRYSFGFSFIEISYFNTGTALVGILTNLIALINAVSLDTNAFFLKGLLYLIFQILTLIAVLVVFARYYAVCVNAPRETARSVRSESDNATLGEENQSTAIVKVPEPSLISTLMLISGFFFNMILIYTITLSIFPAFCFALGIGWDNPAFIQVILLIFNCGDFIGKILYSQISLKDGWLPQIYSLARIGLNIFIILVFSGNGLPQFKNKWWVTTIFILILSISNGYLTSALFSLSSERVPDRHKKNSGFLMTMALLFGLTYGSLCMLLGTS